MEVAHEVGGQGEYYQVNGMQQRLRGDLACHPRGSEVPEAGTGC